MGNLLCLLIGLALPIGAFWTVMRQLLRPLASTNAYRNAAWRLGLEADTQGAALQGHYESRRLFIGTVLSATDGRKKHRAVMDLAIPLGMGLRIRARGRAWPRWRRGRVQNVQFGDPALDERVEVSGFQPEVVKELLQDNVRTALLVLLDRWKDVDVTDTWVRVRLRRPPGTEAALLELVNHLHALTSSLEAARAKLPPGEEAAALLPEWTDLAASNGLTVHPQLVTLSGNFEGFTLHARTLHTDTGLRVDLVFNFESPRPKGLRVESADADDGYWTTRQDVLIGEAVFDETFIIQAYDPEHARAKLTADLRAHLLCLHAVGTVRLTDLGLAIHEVPPDRTSVQDCITRGRAVMESFVA